MTSWTVLAVFELGEGAAPLGAGVIEPFWGADLDFGYCDGTTLTVAARTRAETAEAAQADVIARAFGTWAVAGGRAALSPASVRVAQAI